MIRRGRARCVETCCDVMHSWIHFILLWNRGKNMLHADMFGSPPCSRWLLPGADLWHTEQQAATLLLLNGLLVCKPTLQPHTTTWCRHCSPKKVIAVVLLAVYQLQFHYHPMSFQWFSIHGLCHPSISPWLPLSLRSPPTVEHTRPVHRSVKYSLRVVVPSLSEVTGLFLMGRRAFSWAKKKLRKKKKINRVIIHTP